MGAGDPIFGPDRARAFITDLPEARVHLLEADHFALETKVDEISLLVRDFIDSVSAPRN
jgi:hypothetical protein